MEREYNVPENTNLIINDTSLDTGLVKSAFNKPRSSSPIEFIIFDRMELTRPLAREIERVLEKQNDVCFLFPGEGAKQVLDTLPKPILDDMQAMEAAYFSNTLRKYVQNRPIAVSTGIPDSLISKINNRKFSAINIVDDVVASGITIQTIRNDTIQALIELQPDDTSYQQYIRFSQPQIQIPSVMFAISTWMLQRSANVSKFNTFASVVYSRRSGRVPLNSLSTFLKDDEKGQAVKKAYAAKCYQNSLEFYKIIDKLKKYL